MTNLIDNLLDSSRLVDGNDVLYFHPVEVDLTQLVADVCKLHREISPDSVIADKSDNASIHILGDPKLLTQAVSNIISNAIKYSPTGSPVEVELNSEATCAVIRVSDHGIGIPEKDLQQVFARYYRGSNVSSMSGTGVGLYIVKMVVDLHHGSTEIQSEENMGTQIVIRLPARFTIESRTAHPR
jgi:signal transduction histidine kinase